MAWALDLDGVVWLADTAVPGSAEAVGRLRGRGDRVLFVTNNSALTVLQYLAKLGSMGVPASAEDLVTSAQAAARLLKPGDSAVACAGPGVVEALEERGVKVVEAGPADAVVVGWHRDFDFERLKVAADAVRAGAQLIGTNDDATYPTPEGELPGGGAILAAVAVAGGAVPVVAGKPHDPMVALLQGRAEAVEVVVGDRPSTDGLLAARLGARFALVLTGVTSEADLPVDPAPALIAPDLAHLLEL